jgi:hypothetical protein
MPARMTTSGSHAAMTRGVAGSGHDCVVKRRRLGTLLLALRVVLAAAAALVWHYDKAASGPLSGKTTVRGLFYAAITSRRTVRPRSCCTSSPPHRRWAGLFS